MAAGFLRSFDAALQVFSAGTDPAPRVNPHAVGVMQEVGIDLSAEKPKNVAEFLGQPFDHVITVCGEADQNCPVFAGRVGHRVHIGFRDPAAASGTEEEVRSVFREVRDEIRTRFLDYYQKEIVNSHA